MKCSVCSTLPAALVAKLDEARADGAGRYTLIDTASAAGYRLSEHAIRAHVAHAPGAADGPAAPSPTLFAPEPAASDGVDDDLRAQLDAAEAAIAAARARGLVPKTVRIENRGSEWDAQTKSGLDTLTSNRTGRTITVAPPSAASSLLTEVRQAQPLHVAVNLPLTPAARPAGRKVAVIHLDGQIGYWQDRTGEWHTTHDEAAFDLDLQVTAAVQAACGVDVQVDVGDLLDLPQFSTHASAPSAVRTEAVNRSIARASRALAELAAVAPDSERVWLQGNHEARFIKFLSEKAPHLVGLARAGETVEPVLSLGFLTRAGEYGWTLKGPYPGAKHWLNHNTRVVHGWVAKGQLGGTAAAYLAEEVNTFYGHTCTMSVLYRDVVRGEQRRSFVAAGGGGRMKVDSSVPDGQTPTDFGEPAAASDDVEGKAWHAGVLVVEYDPEGHTLPVVEQVRFINGRCSWRGQVFVARCDADGNPVG